MRDEHLVIHSREEGRPGFVVYLMQKDAELFLFVRVRLDTVLMIQLRVRRPAAEDGGRHVCAGPIKKSRELLPVVHVFECTVFKIGTGNDESVEAARLHLANRFVERVEMSLL